METMRILHLYYDLMNLYGDWGNTAILARELGRRSCAASIDRRGVGDGVDFAAYDFIHIGSGTERSLRACIRDMGRFAGALAKRIDDGAIVLATGNSHELFGRAATGPDGERFEAIGLLDFESFAEDSRVAGDCVFRCSFLPEMLVGFINRAGGRQAAGGEASGSFTRPFELLLGPGVGDATVREGIAYKNLLGTYMTGPLLLRNPPLLRHFADLLCPPGPGKDKAEHTACPLPSGDSAPGRGGDASLFDSLEAAYGLALGELSARIGKRAGASIIAK